MSNQYDDLFDNDDDNSQNPPADGPKALRDAYEKEKARVAALESQLNEIQEAKNAETLKSKIEGAGLPSAAFRLAKGELSEVTDESVTKWIEDNKAEFGATAPSEPSGDAEESAASGPSGVPNLPVEDAAKMQALQNMTPQSYEPDGTESYKAAMSQVLEGVKQSADPFDVYNAVLSSASKD